ncbi:cytochrome C oxidase [Ruegeria sp. ANG-R]|uniref:cytochrome c oxidase subunit II n=1 Tax=Ruegeria sp. ANG-R TaxID=1577903 RepID=UPI00057F2421|nr:cytochrome c oxidase subunit II [Ruegeria sp. ANG-R]KIC41347.1 cytochrome C oxidase [Ruegeria sp. ANG-R]
MKNALMLSGLFTALSSLPVMAQDLKIIGQPVPGGMGFQPAGSTEAVRLQNLDTMILVIITAICVLVAGLLIYCILRFNRRSNPTPARFSHYTPVEIAWTLGPIVILVFIGAFSLPVLFNQQEIPEGDITIKVVGNQWYWTYEYVDHDFAFDSYLLGHPATLDEGARPADADVTPFVLDDAMRAKLTDAGYSEDEWLLATDTAVVVPVGKIIVMQVTASDVIHSWTIPSFGVKQDGVPGRLAELWFRAEQEGIYFGQCSELCGKDHAYMPITVKVVSEEAYEQWLQGALEEYAGQPATYQVASN